ncbi:MAG: NUDIX hydrolase [Trueperaceae bacterium]|nr:NUDIX hydrolase [Trueperaceae bacterium]
MSKTIYQGKILNLKLLDQKWEIVEHAEAVAIVAMNEGKILGVKQHRPAIGATTWEIPAGLIDEGETPEAAAHRELAEETQLKAELELLTQFYTSPGFTNEKIYLFKATKLSPAQGELDEDEDLEPLWLEPKKLWQEIQTGKLASSSPSVLALHMVLSQA